ncbi:hypothetical protein N9B73_05320 [Verrucomicrobiales bacterium]|nr:hypothetical protein [Verrucomicrobiales bacterium]
MAWHWNDDTALTAENFSFAPSGGRFKLVILGLILPCVILYFGIRGWITQEALWVGDGIDLGVSGVTARAISFAYSGIGMLFHFRWVWGILGFHRTFEIGTIFSALGIIGGIAYGFYYELRY